MMIRPRSPLSGIAVIVAAVALASACDESLNPTFGRIRPPAIVAPTGEYVLVGADGTPLPHFTTYGPTTYTLVSGTFGLAPDSTWLYHSVTQQPGPNGTVYTSPANYTGKWIVTDSTIVVQPSYGSIRVRGDTMFWKGGARFSWEDSTIVYAFIRK